MEKWEYKYYYGNGKEIESELNKLGAEGWEMVSAVPDFMNGGSAGIEFFFKRRKEN